MEEILILLKNFVSGKITPEIFVEKYLTLWREIRDNQYRLEEAQGLWQERVKLQEMLSSNKIAKEEFEKRWQKIDKKVQGAEVQPGTKASEILSHLMVEADAYQGDKRGLKKEVRKALKELLNKV